MSLKKFRDEAKKANKSEVQLYLEKTLGSKIQGLENLVMKCLNHLVFSCKEVTTVGGAVTEEFVNSSIKLDMKCHVTLNEEGATPVSIKTAKCGDGKITITFSGDPSNDHKLTYTVCK